ncbi:MAG: glycosyltransferase, partial [Desulfuromusa sp.]|nr:glycosyltransferase [Desulfuromusa sp.]
MVEDNKNIKISVVMIDGDFREKVFGANYFSQQTFPDEEYEIIWVDYFDKIHPDILSNPKVKAICLDKKGIYHSSYCFNRGINQARGELIVIPDADLVVLPDFLDRVWELHQTYEKLVVYGYRYDEVQEGILESLDFKELE